jgi:hypothetical protein
MPRYDIILLLLEFVLVTMASKLNRYVMLTIFFIPLSMIALYESRVHSTKNGWMKSWLDLHSSDRGEVDQLVDRDPEGDGEFQITRVSFDELVKKLPNTAQAS